MPRIKHKDTNITIKITSEQKARYKKIAEARGLTLTNLIIQELDKLE